MGEVVWADVLEPAASRNHSTETVVAYIDEPQPQLTQPFWKRPIYLIVLDIQVSNSHRQVYIGEIKLEMIMVEIYGF